MATVTSASTDAQVKAAFEDAASYREDASVAKALALITSGTILLLREASQMAKGSNSLGYDRTMIERAIREARDYVQNFSTSSADYPGPRVTRSDFRNCRQ